MTPNANTFHLFLSYARADNKAPVNQAGEGWVKAFKAELERRHALYSGRALKVFFDEEDIGIGVDWRRRLGDGLRQSRLFLAFLSPNYLISDNCQWEWDEYLRREHSAARGDDGITPVYFVTPGDLRLTEERSIADWLAATEAKYPWFKARSFKPEAERTARRMAEDLTGRRNKSTHLELQPWFAHGPEVLRELDAAARLAEVKAQPRDSAADLRTLAERLDGLDRHIAQRMDRLALADLAPGNIGRSHEHFVGRHSELRQLHDILLTGGAQSGGRGMGGRGIIAATFAPGGLGKTALARQYAHAYAEWYAAGGTWEIGCEGVSELGVALQRLAESEHFKELALRDRSRAPSKTEDFLTTPLQLSEAQRADPSLALEAVLAYLKRVTFARRDVLLEELERKVQAGEAERHSQAEDPPELKQPRALLLLDNVDQTQLLSAHQLGLLPAEEWLEIVVTTRLNPKAFGGGDKVYAHLEVGVLPEADALQLLADFQPGHAFASADEAQAAWQIVQTLGGWTLALEIVAALIGHHAHDGHPSPAQALYAELAKHGLAWVDTLAGASGVEGQLRHSDEAQRNRIGTLIAWSMARLSAPARTALEYASLLMPDQIPLMWLRELTAQRHPEVNDDLLSNPHSWHAVWGELRGLRLLHPAGDVSTDARSVERMPELGRIHRLVAEHVRGAGLPQHGEALDRFFEALGRAFAGQVGQREDAALRAQHPWLRDQLGFLIGEKSALPRTLTLLRVAGVAAAYEGQHGSLSTALDLTQQVSALLAAKPDSAEAQRNVSVSLNQLADFLALRGQPGDAEAAFAYYQQSLNIAQQLREANPNSAQAARDVSVSLNRLADFLASRGQPGDAEAAFSHYQQCHEVLQQLWQANPNSAEAARDVSVSLNQLADFLARRGQPGDAEAALAHYQKCLSIDQQLWQANPNSAQAARDVSVSVDRLGDFLARRGQPGDAEAALAHYQQSLSLRQQLRAANPNSAQAARDLMISYERLSAMTALQAEGAAAALALQQQALALALQLHQQNPGSWYLQRSAAISCQLTATRAHAVGDEALFAETLTACYALLDQALKAGMAVDPPMRQLHAQLALYFSGAPGEEE